MLKQNKLILKYSYVIPFTTFLSDLFWAFKFDQIFFFWVWDKLNNFIKNIEVLNLRIFVFIFYMFCFWYPESFFVYFLLKIFLFVFTFLIFHVCFFFLLFFVNRLLVYFLICLKFFLSICLNNDFLDIDIESRLYFLNSIMGLDLMSYLNSIFLVVYEFFLEWTLMERDFTLRRFIRETISRIFWEIKFYIPQMFKYLYMLSYLPGIFWYNFKEKYTWFKFIYRTLLSEIFWRRLFSSLFFRCLRISLIMILKTFWVIFYPYIGWWLKLDVLDVLLFKFCLLIIKFKNFIIGILVFIVRLVIFLFVTKDVVMFIYLLYKVPVSFVMRLLAVFLNYFISFLMMLELWLTFYLEDLANRFRSMPNLLTYFFYEYYYFNVREMFIILHKMRRLEIILANILYVYYFMCFFIFYCYPLGFAFYFLCMN
jgi:hypothetical protein